METEQNKPKEIIKRAESQLNGSKCCDETLKRKIGKYAESAMINNRFPSTQKLFK